MSNRQQGVTLIELVVVVVIVGILASIAIPSYRNYVLRANRTEGRAALLALATAQEKFYLQCNTYTTALDPDAATDCDTGTCGFQSPASVGTTTSPSPRRTRQDGPPKRSQLAIRRNSRTSSASGLDLPART